MPNSSGGLA